MRLIIAGTVWPSVLVDFEKSHSECSDLSYSDCQRLLMNEGVGAADFYSKNINQLGHFAEEIIINWEFLQRKWMKEYAKTEISKIPERSAVVKVISKSVRAFVSSTGNLGRSLYHALNAPAHRFMKPQDVWMPEILAAQVEMIKPDVFYTHAVPHLDENFLKRIRPFVKLIVGQHASAIPENVPYHCYDLILSSLPNQVEHFRKMGVKSEYLKWCFEESILKRLGEVKSKYPVSFIGGFSSQHREGWEVFQTVSEKVPIHVWGYGIENLPRESPLLNNFHGEAWGMQMFRVMAESKIVLNRHIEVAQKNANNMRLFEATGSGAMLLTDYKDNLHDLFEDGREVVSYRNADECIEKLKYYLEHEGERAAIAKAGQQRTLKEHTYYHRMQEMLQILKRYIS